MPTWRPWLSRSSPDAGNAIPIRQPDADAPPTAADVCGTPVLRISRHVEPGPGPSPEPLTVVTVAGDIDMDTAESLYATLTDAIDGSRHVRCDLAGVGFFGAAGANTLMAAHRYAASADRRFGVRGARGVARRVLELTGLDLLLTVDG